MGKLHVGNKNFIKQKKSEHATIEVAPSQSIEQKEASNSDLLTLQNKITFLETELSKKEKVVWQVIKETPVEKVITKEVPVERIVEKIVTKEVPVEKVVYKDKLIYMDKIIEKPVRVVETVENQISSTPFWMKLAVTLETLTIVYLLIK